MTHKSAKKNGYTSEAHSQISQGKKSLHHGRVGSQLTIQLKNIKFELCKCSHVQHSLLSHKRNKEKWR